MIIETEQDKRSTNRFELNAENIFHDDEMFSDKKNYSLKQPFQNIPCLNITELEVFIRFVWNVSFIV